MNQILVLRRDTGPVLEVMSGDGRLTEFLRPHVNREIIATDAMTGRDDIAYPKWILKRNALAAVAQFRPSVVIICWEPYFSDVSLRLVDMGISLVWIGSVQSSAVGVGLLEKEHMDKKQVCHWKTR